MAETLAIIGLISNIISFIDFGYRVVSEARTLRESIHDAPAEIRELRIILNHVDETRAQIERQKSSGQKLSNAEANIAAMADECSRLASQLSNAIEKLSKRAGARFQTLESGRVVAQTMWKRKEIADVRSRLESMDRRLRGSLADALQGSVLHISLYALNYLIAEHSALKRTVDLYS
jgi:methyl-accepting chemotaxis protein